MRHFSRLRGYMVTKPYKWLKSVISVVTKILYVTKVYGYTFGIIFANL